MDRACTIAENQVAHIARLVDDLLDVSRIARGKVQLKSEEVDLVRVIQGVVRDYQPVFAENELALEASLPPGPVRIDADPARVVQMVSNLLHNAIKFTDPGGKVGLSVEVPDGTWAQVAVRDSGAGIPAKCLHPCSSHSPSAGRPSAGPGAAWGWGWPWPRGWPSSTAAPSRPTATGPGPAPGSSSACPAPRPRSGRSPGSRVPARPHRPRAPDPGGGRPPDAATTLRLLLEMLGHTVATAYDGGPGWTRRTSFHPEIILCDIGLPGSWTDTAWPGPSGAPPAWKRSTWWP